MNNLELKMLRGLIKLGEEGYYYYVTEEEFKKDFPNGEFVLISLMAKGFVDCNMIGSKYVIGITDWGYEEFELREAISDWKRKRFYNESL